MDGMAVLLTEPSGTVRHSHSSSSMDLLLDRVGVGVGRMLCSLVRKRYGELRLAVAYTRYAGDAICAFSLLMNAE